MLKTDQLQCDVDRCFDARLIEAHSLCHVDEAEDIFHSSTGVRKEG